MDLVSDHTGNDIPVRFFGVCVKVIILLGCFDVFVAKLPLDQFLVDIPVDQGGSVSLPNLMRRSFRDANGSTGLFQIIIKSLGVNLLSIPHKQI